MKKFLLLFCFAICALPFSYSQTPGEWTWIKGSSTFNAGTYGMQGVPAPLNDAPSLYEPCEWKDNNGNFWLYGGWMNNGALNDLWRYNPVTNEWTWMTGTQTFDDVGNFGAQGVPSPSNHPPSLMRASASWTDLNGNLWMFGGISGTVKFADLWMYNVSTNLWTWMKGPGVPNAIGSYGVQGVPSPANNPSSRCEAAASWVDNSGNLWFFGGEDYQMDVFNDLWRYEPLTNTWTWMKGSQMQGQQGIYGIKGIEDPANTPGARMSYCRWTDLNGNFWLFGGGNFTTTFHHNDLWKFNYLTNSWTWVSGSDVPNYPGNYGPLCNSDSAWLPEARFENRAAWRDNNNNLWMFGGAQGSGGLPDKLSDLWKYCISENLWTLVSGSNAMNQTGYWGTMGVSDPANQPSGRGGSVSWFGDDGHLYLFGGYTLHNDVWRYVIDETCGNCSTVPLSAFSAPNVFCPGSCTNFTNLSVNATSYQWSFPGAIPSSSTDANPTNICYPNSGNYDVQLIAGSSTGSDTLLLANYITVYPAPPPQSIYQSGDTLFASQGAVSYQWYRNGSILPGATNHFYVAITIGDYNVVATDVNGCEVEAVIYDVIAKIEDQFAPDSYREDNWQLAIFPNPVRNKLTLEIIPSLSVEAIKVFDVVGQEVAGIKIHEAGKHYEIDVSALSSGIYFIQVTAGHKQARQRFIKQ